jgi:hypothetical protein
LVDGVVVWVEFLGVPLGVRRVTVAIGVAPLDLGIWFSLSCLDLKVIFGLFDFFGGVAAFSVSFLNF